MMMMLPQNLTRVLIILVLVCQTFFIFFQSLYGAPAPSFNPQHQELSPQTASDGVPNFHSIAIYSKANETQPIPQQQSYSQAKQDMIILHLTDANDAKQKEKNHTTHHADSSRQKFFVAWHQMMQSSYQTLSSLNGTTGVGYASNQILSIGTALQVIEHVVLLGLWWVENERMMVQRLM